MEKKRSKIKILGIKLNDLVRLGTVIGTCVGVALYLDTRFDGIEQTMNRKFDQVDRRFDKVEARLDRVEGRLDKIEINLDKTNSLLDAYLTWRFIYINDPERKNLLPLYDPRSRTLEFVDKTKARTGH